MARPTDDPKTIKFQMMMSPREAEQIDDWGFSNRIRSRAEAIRRLCQAGLAVDEAALSLEAEVHGMEYGVRKVVLDLVDALQKKMGTDLHGDIVKAIRSLMRTQDEVIEHGRVLQNIAKRTGTDQGLADIDEVLAKNAELSEEVRQFIVKLDEEDIP